VKLKNLLTFKINSLSFISKNLLNMNFLKIGFFKSFMKKKFINKFKTSNSVILRNKLFFILKNLDLNFMHFFFNVKVRNFNKEGVLSNSLFFFLKII
jgi:hypothetical protein